MKTKSYTYIFPMLAEELIDPKINLVNVYLNDANKPEIKDRILLLYEFTPDIEFLRFEEEVKWSLYYDGKYDLNDDYVVMMFRIPEYHKKDYDLIMQGKYSEISEDYKHKIINFHNLPDFSQVTGVLYRKEFAYKIMEKKINEGLPEAYWTRIPRDLEASSIMDIEKETLKYKVANTIIY